MSIVWRLGDIFTTECTRIVAPVNTVGVMGAGLAKQIASRFPWALPEYRAWCSAGRKGGDVGLSDEHNGVRLIWAATKEHWKQPSKPEWVGRALYTLAKRAVLAPVAVPMLGAGLGGLDVSHVKRLMEITLGESAGEFEVWEPA